MCSTDAPPQFSYTDNTQQLLIRKLQCFLLPRSLLKTIKVKCQFSPREIFLIVSISCSIFFFSFDAVLGDRVGYFFQKIIKYSCFL